MKKLFGAWLVLLFVVNTLGAWTYYGYDFGGYYPGTWHYPSSYEGYPDWSGQPRPTQPTQPTQPVTPTKPSYPVQKQPTTTQPMKSQNIEDQFPNLIVMFTKDACPYCQYMKPIMNQVEQKFGKGIKFLYVDITQYPNTPAQYGFSTVPQIMYFKNGKRLETHGSGDKTMTVEQVEAKIKQHFSEAAAE